MRAIRRLVGSPILWALGSALTFGWFALSWTAAPPPRKFVNAAGLVAPFVVPGVPNGPSVPEFILGRGDKLEQSWEAAE